MAVLELPYRFTPREYQKPLFKAILNDNIKRAVCCWHRRAGKDKSFLNLLAIQAMRTMGNYAYYFPTATLGRKAMWDNIDARSGMKVIDHLPPEIVAKKNEQQMKITLINGSTIQILGTDSLDVVGGNYYGVIFSETAQQNPLAWEYTRPILRENGGWVLFNGTPRGKNWFHRLFNKNVSNPAWFCQLLTIEDTGALSQADLEEERLSGMTEQMIRQEYYCDWTVGLMGAIYAREVEQSWQDGRILDFEPDGGALVHTAWDIGSPENTAVTYFQRIGPRLQIIDYDTGLNLTTTQRVAHMMRKGYNYGFHCLPHDADSKAPTGLSFRQELEKHGLQNVKTIDRTTDPEIRINKARESFSTIWFRKSHTEKLISALEAYHRKDDPKTITITSQIVHDWASHGADSFGYIFEAEMQGLIQNIIPEADNARHRVVTGWEDW